MYKVKNSDIMIVIGSSPSIFANRSFPTKVAYWLSRLHLKEFPRLLKEYDEERVRILEDCASKDENGKVKLENTQYVFDTDSDRVRANDKIRELLDLEVEINIDKIDVQVASLPTGISANDISMLDPFVNFIEN